MGISKYRAHPENMLLRRSKWEKVGDFAYLEPVKAVAIMTAFFFILNRLSHFIIGMTGLIKVSMSYFSCRILPGLC